MWIFCCGMKRAGSTVQYQITSEIVETFGIGKRLGFVNEENFQKIFNENSSHEDFFVIKVHEFFEQARELIDNHEAKAIYIYRDIRDVSVSLQKKSYKSFWRFLLSGELDNLIKHYKLWNTVSSIMVSQYELMIEDLASEALMIADYLGVPLGEENAKFIADKYSLDRQLEMIQNFDYEKDGYSIGKKNIVRVNPYSLLHRNHIRSGATKQWEKEFTHLQIGLIELLTYEWLLDRGYEISQPWVNPQIVRPTKAIMKNIWQFKGFVKKST